MSTKLIVGRHYQDHYIVRNVMFALYCVLVVFCALYAKDALNTCVITTGGLLSAMFGIHTVGSYLSQSPVVTTNPD
jgi:hypothetical protein